MAELIHALAKDEVRIYTLDSGDNETVRAAARCILAGLLRCPPREIEFDRGDKGKPYLRNDRSLYFSITHSRDVSMVAVTRVADVGVDIEQVRVVPQAETILKRFFGHEEIASILSDDHRDLRFAQAWTRGEATVKVRGASVWEVATPDPRVSVTDLRAPRGFVAAVAVAAAQWEASQLGLSVSELLDGD